MGIALAIMGTVLVSAIIVGGYKLYKLNKNMTTLAELFLTHLVNPEQVDVVEDYPMDRKVHFPNSEGF